MRILLDSNAYSAFNRGNHEVRASISVAEEIVFSAIVAGEQLFGYRLGTNYDRNLSELRWRPRTSIRVIRPSGSGNRRPLFQDCGRFESIGASQSHKRCLDSRPFDGDRRRSGSGRRAFRACSPHCVGQFHSDLICASRNLFERVTPHARPSPTGDLCITVSARGPPCHPERCPKHHG